MAATSVRRAGPDDAGGIADVHVRAWQAAYRGIMPDDVLDGLSVPQWERRRRARLARDDGGSFTLVPERESAVAGFCGVATPSRDDDAGVGTAEIAAIYVDPDHWRDGVGTALLTTAMDELRRGGWQEATLWVFAENHRARAFYSRFGFEADGTEKPEERSGRTEIRLRAPLPSPVAPRGPTEF